MDGVSKGGKNQPPDAGCQANKLTAQGQHNDKVVDTTEQETAIPAQPLPQQEDTGLWERKVSIADESDIDWSDDDDAPTSGFSSDADPISSDEDFSLPGYGGSLDAIGRAENKYEEDIVFQDDEEGSSSGIDSESLSSTNGSCDNLAVQEAVQEVAEVLPEAISLGKMPEPSSAASSHIIIDNVESADGQSLRVVRYIPQDQNRKGWIIRSRNIDASDDEAKTSYEADRLEAEILSSLESENIINFHGFVGTTDPQTYTTHLCIKDGGLTMAQAITQVESARLVPTMASWLFDLARGLVVLKQNHILHRDIKPDNLLVDMDENRLRIADFGNAHQVIDYRFPSDASGSARYSAPEVINRKPQYYSADIYSAGISFIEIMMDANVLTVCTWQEFSQHYSQHYPQRSPVALAEPHCHHRSAPVLAALVNRMIQQNPDHRPKAETIVSELQEHGWQS